MWCLVENPQYANPTGQRVVQSRVGVLRATEPADLIGILGYVVTWRKQTQCTTAWDVEVINTPGGAYIRTWAPLENPRMAKAQFSTPSGHITRSHSLQIASLEWPRVARCVHPLMVVNPALGSSFANDLYHAASGGADIPPFYSNADAGDYLGSEMTRFLRECEPSRALCDPIATKAALEVLLGPKLGKLAASQLKGSAG